MPDGTRLDPGVALGIRPPQVDPLGQANSLLDLQNKLNQNRLFQEEFQSRQKLGQYLANAPSFDEGIQAAMKDPDVAGFAGSHLAGLQEFQRIQTSTRGLEQEQSQTALQAVYRGLVPAIQDPTRFPEYWKAQMGTLPPAARTKVQPQLDALYGMLEPMARTDPQGFRSVAQGLAVGGGVDPAMLRGLIQPPPGPQVGRSPSIGTQTMTQAPVLSPSQERISSKLGEQFAGQETEDFNRTQQAQASLQNMEASLDELVRSKSAWLQPGPGAQFRQNLAEVANGVYQMAGQKVPFDPLALGSALEFQKESARMLGQVTQQFFGGSHVAQGTVENIKRAVPQLESSYLGSKIVIESIRQALQRGVDRYNFKSDWEARNAGNLDQAERAFNQEHPPEEYVKRVTDKFGLKEGGLGFKSPQEVAKAKQQGWITDAEAIRILKDWK